MSFVLFFTEPIIQLHIGAKGKRQTVCFCIMYESIIVHELEFRHYLMQLDLSDLARDKVSGQASAEIQALIFQRPSPR